VNRCVAGFGECSKKWFLFISGGLLDLHRRSAEGPDLADSVAKLF
jgi:hypothetical protein